MQTLILRLEGGRSVQARDVQLVLSKPQLAAMRAEWEKQKQLRKPNKPKEITAYEKALRSAVMWQGRLEAYKVSRPTTYRVVIDRASKQRELEQKAAAKLVDAKSLLAVIKASVSKSWLDRAVRPTAIPALTADQMPRAITSRSSCNVARSTVRDRLGFKSITEIKLAALRDALKTVNEQIDLDYPPLTPNDQQKLKALLTKLKSER